METKFEKTGPTTGRLDFTIDQETVKKGLDKTFKKVQKTLNVPGFRKGRVPRRIFNQMYGEAALYEDTLNDLLPDAYSKAISEVDVEPVAQPNIDIKSVEKNQDWELIAELTLKPDVELGQYKELDVTKQDRTVTEEEVTENIEKRRQDMAELVLKEDAAEEGDTVVIDYEGFKGDEPFEGGKDENHSLELGSNSFIPGFEEQLIGSKAGEEKEVNLTFPEDYQAEDLAGEEVTFKVTVHEVKSKELPELDDEFVKDLDEDVETVDELKEKVRKELEENKNSAANDAKDDEAIKKAVENAKIEEIPAEMAHEEVHRQMEMFLNNLKQQGISADMYYQMTGSTEADLHKQFEGEAEFNVRTNLVLETIVEEEKLEATEEDREKEISDLAGQYNMDVEQVKNVLSPQLLNRDISLKKAIDLITSTANETLESKNDSDSE
ncbi:MAG: trigger factor [Alkalibacterium gilvum]|uniref:Trigger factor n=1 Tax=Alkalibacterium gilvum TaxID=1130080 RepID=A0A1H6RBN4_9LACT|nr:MULTISPECIES: trigger factor [Alkalibacterium]MDN6293113.1 trigger factor [Alkalibacterium sp.]MDN6294772.1 trigger factor [Alkalibacterium sp.]MDN6385475.1 trigger factor [Alkalibacterium sp.]MDN6397558.1 trigger factor [Alkalibacterium sp.]MDN6728560.1 trigger factor [Alkalibacterium sp.]